LHFQQDRLDQAERDFRLATTTGFEPSAAYLNLAMIQEARGELADAKVSIERALSTRPDFEEAHRLKARLSGQQP
jgi:Tfp pilus assembly protein PilF